MSKTAAGRKIPLAKTMRGVLSDRALQALEALSLQRNLAQTTSTENLHRLFAEHSWPLSEEAVDLERLGGGLEVHPGVYFGLYAQTQSQSQYEARASVMHFVDTGMYSSLYYGRAARIRQERVGAVHVAEWAQLRSERTWSVLRGLGHDVFLSVRGRIGLSNVLDVDDDYYPEEIWDSTVHYFEVAALVRDAMLFWFDGTDPLGWHRVWLDRPLGASIASDLFAEPFAPATGSKCSAWVREALHIVERRSVHFYNDTTMGTPETAEAFELVGAALKHSRDVLWIAPSGAVSGAMLASLPRCVRGGGAGCEVFSWGEPEGYFPRDYRPDLRWPTG